jgi:alkylation response protein AidB-like acyl-CoA dehydrogenase
MEKEITTMDNPTTVDQTKTQLESNDYNQALVQYAASLVPTLKQRAKETATLGRLPAETIADLETGDLLSMMIPRVFGGQQTTVRTFLDVAAELGRGDASVAWVVSLINVTTWGAATFFGEKAAQEVFNGTEPAKVSGVLSPRKAVVKKVEGGYLIEEGLWGFNSGVYHSNWDMLGIPLVNEQGDIVDQGIVLVPTSELEILNDWDVIAISGSGSSSVSARNLFVPDHRVTSLTKAINGDYNSTHLDGESLYRVACMPMLAIILTFPALGVGMAALETFLAALPRRAIQYSGYAKQAEAPVTHLQVGEASAKIEAARAIMEKHADALDACAKSGKYMDFHQRAKVRRDVGYAETLIWSAVDMLATASGGSLAGSKNPFTKIWQDARIASLHGIVTPATNFETYGRILCGQDAGTPFI